MGRSRSFSKSLTGPRLFGRWNHEHGALGEVEQLVRDGPQEHALDRVLAVGADDDCAGVVLVGLALSISLSLLGSRHDLAREPSGSSTGRFGEVW